MQPDDDAIASHVARALPRARWFAAKGRTIERLTIHDRLALPASPGSADGGGWLLLADVHAGSAAHRYCLAVDADGDDAAGTPDFARWLLHTALTRSRETTRCGTIIGHGVSESAVAPDAATPLEVSPVGGEASNSSFVVRAGAAGFVVKVFRHCRSGVQPEVEVGEFLARYGSSLQSPRLLGWLEYVPPDGSSTALATVHDLVPDCTTAWDRLVGLLVAGPGDASGADDVHRLVAAIGGLTGQMHRALAGRHDVPAFAPDVPSAADRRATAERMARHAAGVFALVASRLPLVAAPLADRLRRLLAARDSLIGRFAGLGTLGPHVPAIRVHGDYHLGQVLVGERTGHVMVIDFEGEPGRPLDERREKTSAAKDVAGMCRSLDYLLRHAASVTGRAFRPEDVRRLEAAFLDAYGTVAAGEPWWPGDVPTAAALLDAYRLDKALYELAYEINNRPDWITVPLAALEELAAPPAPSRA